MKKKRFISMYHEENGTQGVRKPGDFADAPNAPVFGGKLGSVVPEADQEAFLRFAKDKPRLMRVLGKEDLSEQDLRAVEAAYEDMKGEKQERALMLVEARSLSPVIGFSEEETVGLLEIYKPADLRRLALVAQEQELESRDVITVDSELLLDGSYVGREAETITVSSVHNALNRIILDEFERVLGHTAVTQEDGNLDNVWEVLLEKHDGDEKKAAVEYLQSAKEIVTGAKSKVVDVVQEQLSTDQVVELFKLFNYDRGDIGQFLEYAENNFSLDDMGEKPTFGAAVDEMFGDVLDGFVMANAKLLNLNERSNFYRRARRAQLEVRVGKGEIGSIALQSVGVTVGSRNDGQKEDD